MKLLNSGSVLLGLFYFTELATSAAIQTSSSSSSQSASDSTKVYSDKTSSSSSHDKKTETSDSSRSSRTSSESTTASSSSSSSSGHVSSSRSHTRKATTTARYETITLASGLVATGDETVLFLESTSITPGTAEYTIGSHTVSFGSSGALDVDGTTTVLPPTGGLSSSSSALRSGTSKSASSSDRKSSASSRTSQVSATASSTSHTSAGKSSSSSTDSANTNSATGTGTDTKSHSASSGKDSSSLKTHASNSGTASSSSGAPGTISSSNSDHSASGHHTESSSSNSTSSSTSGAPDTETTASNTKSHASTHGTGSTQSAPSGAKSSSSTLLPGGSVSTSTQTPTPSVVIATVSGVTETASFIPTILPAYTSVTAQTTITTSDGSHGLIPLIIFAGGAAWFPFGLIPKFPVPAPISPPPIVPIVPIVPGGPGGESTKAGASSGASKSPASSASSTSSSSSSSSSGAVCAIRTVQSIAAPPPVTTASQTGSQTGSITNSASSQSVSGSQTGSATNSGSSQSVSGSQTGSATISGSSQSVSGSQTGSTASSSSGGGKTQTAVPIASPSCQKNTVPNYATDKKYVINETTTTDINTLLLELRQMSCNNQCALPAGLPSGVAVATVTDSGSGCEMAVALPFQAEAYLYRATPATDVEQQECWNSTINIVQDCVQNGPNAGFWNGDHAYQFYQAGLRPINGNGARHSSLNPTSTLFPAPSGTGIGLPSVIPSTSSTAAPVPTGAADSVTCPKDISGETAFAVPKMDLVLNNNQGTDIIGLLSLLSTALCATQSGVCQMPSSIPSGSGSAQTSNQGDCSLIVMLPEGLIAQVGDNGNQQQGQCQPDLNAIIEQCIEPNIGNSAQTWFTGTATAGKSFEIYSAALGQASNTAVWPEGKPVSLTPLPLSVSATASAKPDSMR